MKGFKIVLSQWDSSAAEFFTEEDIREFAREIEEYKKERKEVESNKGSNNISNLCNEQPE